MPPAITIITAIVDERNDGPATDDRWRKSLLLLAPGILCLSCLFACVSKRVGRSPLPLVAAHIHDVQLCLHKFARPEGILNGNIKSEIYWEMMRSQLAFHPSSLSARSVAA